MIIQGQRAWVHTFPCRNNKSVTNKLHVHCAVYTHTCPPFTSWVNITIAELFCPIPFNMPASSKHSCIHWIWFVLSLSSWHTCIAHYIRNIPRYLYHVLLPRGDHGGDLGLLCFSPPQHGTIVLVFVAHH